MEDDNSEEIISFLLQEKKFNKQIQQFIKLLSKLDDDEPITKKKLKELLKAKIAHEGELAAKVK